MNKERLTEALAAQAHEVWANWMRYMFSKAEDFGNSCEIHSFEYERWKRQMNTPYAALSENEKKSDREIAEKIIAVIDYEQDLSNVELHNALKAFGVYFDPSYDFTASRWAKLKEEVDPPEDKDVH